MRREGHAARTPVHRVASLLLYVVALLVVMASAPGCGKKGPPLPPLRSVPERVARASIRQVGDRLVMTFPRPASRTDGTPLGPDASLEVLMTARYPAPKRAAEIELSPDLSWTVPRSQWDAYTQGRRMEVGLSLGSLAAALDQPQGGDAMKHRKLSFVVTIVEARNKRSLPSEIETFEICEPPPAPAAIAVRIVEDGLLLAWTPGEPGAMGATGVAGVAGAPGKVATAGTPGTTNATAPEGADKGGAFNIYRQEEGGVRSESPLRSVTPQTLSYLDTTAVIGTSYRYAVRAVSTATRCESAETPAAVATRLDLFPPAAPQGLVAVAEKVDDKRTIRLFWRPNRETDLRGYRIYRADGPDKPWKMLTPDDLTATSYTDEDVMPGVVYSYVVTARDGASPPNESLYSDPAIEQTEAGK
jgi:hypothetical protein